MLLFSTHLSIARAQNMQRMNTLNRMKQLVHKAMTFTKVDEKLSMEAYTKELQMSHREKAPSYCPELNSALMTKSTLIIIFTGLIMMHVTAFITIKHK